MASFREAFLGKRFVCCALTIVYSIYNTVGRSIASIYDLGSIFTSALHASVNMSPRVIYIGYGPPYHTIYITHNIYIYIIILLNLGKAFTEQLESAIFPTPRVVPVFYTVPFVQWLYTV